MMMEENVYSEVVDVDLIFQVKMGCVRDDCVYVRCYDLGKVIK